MVDSIFFSRAIRAELLKDPLVRWENDEASFEQRYEYRLPDEFLEDVVHKPAAYLLDRAMRHLQLPCGESNLEADTARLFLACCSGLDGEE